MRNLEGNIVISDESEISNNENQGRDINNLVENNNKLTSNNHLTHKFHVLNNSICVGPNKLLKKALFRGKPPMSSSNVKDDTSELENVSSTARKGSLVDIVNRDDNTIKPMLNNYKTWPERFDKYKDNNRETKPEESVNIHVNNGFALEDNNSLSKDGTIETNGKDSLNTTKKEIPGCLDMSKNSGTMRLTQALDNISLAYNPITKQLHFVSTKNTDKNKPCSVSSECDSKKGSFSDEGISLSCGDKCDSVSSESPESTLVRTGHQRGTDGGSFSSTISSLSECSLPSSCNSKDDPQLSPQDESRSDSSKGKKKGLSSFFSRKGSLVDIVNRDDNTIKPMLNNYKTWPERFDKYKDNNRETKPEESVNIHVNNGFALEDNNSLSKDGTIETNGKDSLNTTKKEIPGCLDMSKNSGTMRLTQALDNISLAYNPITKQLHFVSTKNTDKNKPCSVSSECDSKKGSFSDEGISLSCGDKCDSVSSESPESTLVRTGHQRGTDGGSFSSTISSLSECSLPSSCNSKDDPQLSPQDESRSDSSKGKKKGLSSFFSRGVFPWRSAGHSSQSPCKLNDNPVIGSTWRLFGGRSSAPPNVTSPTQPTSLELSTESKDQQPAAGTPISSGASTPQHQRHRRQGSSASNGEGKLFDDLVASSIALIQHNRPSNLPAKDEAEEIRHRQEYQRIVEAARKKEAREARERRKQLAKQARHEESLSAALREWNQSVLPYWDTMKNSRKARDLWWCGIPAAVRGKVWQLAIPNNLNITPQLYHICVERAKQKLVEVKFKKNTTNKVTAKQNGVCHNKMETDSTETEESNFKLNGFYKDMHLDRNNKLSHINNLRTNDDSRLGETTDFSKLRNHSEQNLSKHTEFSLVKKSSQSDPDLCEFNNERSMELIQLDISRTFPSLCMFQPGGPYFDVLHELLAAYVCYRPDVGYVQGMSFLAAVLILNMESAEAFICFANLLNGPVLRAAFTLDAQGVQALWAAHLHLLQAQLPALHAHHTETKLSPELYLLEWLYSGFAKAMPLDVACRVWDVFLRDGEEFLFRTALGVLHLYQEELLQMDFITASQFLTKLPEDLSGDALFKSISCINMSVDKMTFQQLVDKFKEEPYLVADDQGFR